MKRIILFAAFLLSIGALMPAATASAGTAAQCTADPSHGQPGTVFHVVCSGFSPNTWLNVWAVDPSGVAQSGQEAPGAPNNIKSNEKGEASFSWVTPAHETGWYFATGLGDWIWYVNQLCGGQACIVGTTSIHIDRVEEAFSGASLAVTPNPVHLTDTLIGFVVYRVTGSGFAPNEYVNLWLTQPPLCDRGQFSFAMSAIDMGTVKADLSGNISLQSVFSAYNCIGQYVVTARALGSGRGAEAAFALMGNDVKGTFGDTNTLVISPDHVRADLRLFEPAFTVSGSGYEPKETGQCRATRPDGRSSFPIDFRADEQGNLNAGAGGFAVDSFWANYASQPGVWRITCQGDKSGVIQFGQFTVIGDVVDP